MPTNNDFVGKVLKKAQDETAERVCLSYEVPPPFSSSQATSHKLSKGGRKGDGGGPTKAGVWGESWVLGQTESWEKCRSFKISLSVEMQGIQ